MAAPTNPTPAPAAPAPSAIPKPRRLLLLLTWAVLATAVVASGAAAWLLLFQGPRAEAVARGPSHVLKAGTVVVNIPNTDGRRYLRATIELGAASAKDLKRLDEQRAPVIDAAIGVLSGTELAGLLDPARREELKSALRAKLNATVGGQPVTQVFFTEFVVQ